MYLDGEHVRVYYRGNMKTCGRCHQGAQLCRGGGIARECQEEGGARKDLFQHMHETWLQIGFSPTSFELPEKENEDDVENFGGDQEVLNLPNFPRTINQPTQSDSEIFSKTRITNLPKDISDEEASTFLKENVDKSISVLDIEIVRNEFNSQLIIGPGPSKAIVAKTAETLDYHRTQKYFFQDRKLYARPFKPLSPVKPAQEPDDSGKADSKVMSAVVSLESKKNPITPSKTPISTQAKKASATTAPISKHKQGGLASGPPRK